MIPTAPDSASAPPAVVLPADWVRRFFTIWTGQAFSLLGSMLVQFALVWWLTEKTGSATILATATLAGMLPQIFLTPVAGALVDRWNRRVVMMAADSIIALATVVLAVLFWLDVVQVWHVYVIMFVRSAAGGFHWPAMDASTALMVPRDHLSRIQGINQALGGFMNILAPPLGALLVDALPMQGVLAIDVVTAALAITPLVFIDVPQPPRRATESGGGARAVWRDMQAGLRYVRAWRGLFLIMLLGGVIGFLDLPISSLMPILITGHFHGGAPQLGWLQAAWGIGMVTGGITLGVWGGFKRRVVTTMTGLFGFGIGTLILGLAPPNGYWMALVSSLVAGFMFPVMIGPIYAIVQATVAPEMQGRVLTLMNSLFLMMSPLSLIIAGPVTDLVGVQFWYLMAGTAYMLIAVVIAFIPAIMQIEENNYAAVDGGAAAAREPAAN